ncbi:MAG: hypothetical protein Q9M35_01775 [Rhodothermus sp.]|nr:hypothetical protein [Rhodothermus sp.]
MADANAAHDPGWWSARDGEMVALLEQLSRDLQALVAEVEQAYRDGDRLLQRVQAVLRPDLLRNAAHLQVRLEGLRDQVQMTRELVERLRSATCEDRPAAERDGERRLLGRLFVDAQVT